MNPSRFSISFFLQSTLLAAISLRWNLEVPQTSFVLSLCFFFLWAFLQCKTGGISGTHTRIGRDSGWPKRQQQLEEDQLLKVHKVHKVQRLEVFVFVFSFSFFFLWSLLGMKRFPFFFFLSFFFVHSVSWEIGNGSWDDLQSCPPLSPNWISRDFLFLIMDPDFAEEKKKKKKKERPRKIAESLQEID